MNAVAPDPPTPKPTESDKDDILTLDELVDEASMDSFPASDPPSYWGRTSEPSKPADTDQT